MANDENNFPSAAVVCFSLTAKQRMNPDFEMVSPSYGFIKGLLVKNTNNGGASLSKEFMNLRFPLVEPCLHRQARLAEK